MGKTRNKKKRNNGRNKPTSAAPATRPFSGEPPADDTATTPSRTDKKRGRPLPLVTLERLRERRTRITEWVGGVLDLPFVIEEPSPYRPDLLVWMELPAGVIVASELIDPNDLAAMTLADLYQRAVVQPLEGQPRRPDRVRVTTPDDASLVRTVVDEDTPIIVGPAPELDEFRQDMLAHRGMNADPGTGGDDAPGMEAVNATYLGAGADPDTVAAFFQSTSLMRVVNLWEVIPSDQEVRLDIQHLDVTGACITTMGTQSRGIAIFPSQDDYFRFAEEAEGVGNSLSEPSPSVMALGSRWWLVTLEDPANVPSSLIEESVEFDWEPSDPDLFPLLLCVDADGYPSPTSERDFQIAIAAVSALSSLVARGGRELRTFEDPDAEPFSVSFGPGEGELTRLTSPYEAFEFFEPVATPSGKRSGQASDDFRPRASRNAPCPCGSGKKYKKCCLDSDREAAALEGPHERDHRLVMLMMGFADHVLGVDVPELAEKYFDFPADTVELLMTWGAYVMPVVGDRTLASVYVESGQAADLEDHRWLQAQRDAYLSMWSAKNVVPGVSIEFEDRFTGKRVTVQDKKASATVTRESVVLARIVEFEGKSFLCGTHPQSLPPRNAAWVEHKIRNKLRRKKAVDPELLRSFTVSKSLLKRWEEAIDGLYFEASRPPAMHNTDGDPICLTQDTFALRKNSREKVESQLSDLDGLDCDATVVKETTLIRVCRSKSDSSEPGALSSTLIATLSVTDRSLKVETNSTRRADLMRSEIERICGSHITWKKRKATSEEEIRNSMSDPTTPRTPKPEPTSSSGLTEEERHALELEAKDRHYRDWIHVRLPALGNKSPLDAARTAEGRRKLDELLRDMEFRENLGSGSRYDFGPIRRSLGL